MLVDIVFINSVIKFSDLTVLYVRINFLLVLPADLEELSSG